MLAGGGDGSDAPAHEPRIAVSAASGAVAGVPVQARSEPVNLVLTIDADNKRSLSR